MVVAVGAVLVTAALSIPPLLNSMACPHLSSNSRASLRKHFLHFLQAKTISKTCCSSWSEFSWWHSAQSYHLRPGGTRHYMSLAIVCADSERLTAGRADGDLGVEDVLAAERERRSWRGT